MALINTTIVFLFMLGAMKTCMAQNATYFVGEEKGWQRLGFNYYPKWASGKNFHVGDTLVFQYDPNKHDVIEVDEEQFDSCTAQSPTHEYHSGVDNVVLENRGRYFFICSSSGHCDAGQKLKILVDYEEPTVDPIGYVISASSTLSSNFSILIKLIALAAVFVLEYIFVYAFQRF